MGNHTASKESQCSSLERSYNSMLFMDWLQRWGKHGFSKITHRKIVTKAKFSHVCFPRGCRLYNVVFQLLSHIWLFATPWTPAQKASLSFTISLSLLKLMSTELVMPSNHLILCRPLLLLPSVFPSIRVFSNELALHVRWPEYWSFSFSICPSSEYSYLPLLNK